VFLVKNDLLKSGNIFSVIDVCLQMESVKNLGIHLDKRLTWKPHILPKKKLLQLKIRRLYWQLGHHSKLSLENKLLLYKSIIISVVTEEIV